MARSTRLLTVAGLATATAGLVAAGVLLAGAGDQHLTVVLPAATNLVEGTPIRIHGFPAGEVESVAAVGNQAQVRFSVDADHAPLHDGATVRIGWKSLLGERIFEVTDGLPGSPALPDGATVPGRMPAPVEIDDVLSMLDPPTRQRLVSVVGTLDKRIGGSTRDVNATLKASGPALDALGNVLRGVGSDGAAVRSIVTKLDGLVGILDDRDAQVRGTVADLSGAATAVAGQRERIGQVLAKTPGVLDKATAVLGDVPATVDAASPLLRDLRPAAARLRPVAANLNPLLDDLRPAVDDLRPTLDSASRLLDRTPDLLDDLHDRLPEATGTLKHYAPALEFLRPYTPELAGWMSNWASSMANYDGGGHYARGMVQFGAEAWNANPTGFTAPGVAKDLTPVPGAASGEPWTDAFGSGIR
jgi:phospholipid/cholesterol/gamma-HCH transport system substrate-binding protein